MKQMVELARYLSSDGSPDNCLGLSDLDGFVTGVICCPEHIPVLEWLDVALGNIDEVPGTIAAIVTAHYTEIKKDAGKPVWTSRTDILAISGR